MLILPILCYKYIQSVNDAVCTRSCVSSTATVIIQKLPIHSVEWPCKVSPLHKMLCTCYVSMYRVCTYALLCIGTSLQCAESQSFLQCWLFLPEGFLKNLLCSRSTYTWWNSKHVVNNKKMSGFLKVFHWSNHSWDSLPQSGLSTTPLCVLSYNYTGIDDAQLINIPLFTSKLHWPRPMYLSFYLLP